MILFKAYLVFNILFNLHLQLLATGFGLGSMFLTACFCSCMVRFFLRMSLKRTLILNLHTRLEKHTKTEFEELGFQHVTSSQRYCYSS